MSQGVLIDVTPVLKPQITGIGVYVGELIGQLCSLQKNDFQLGYYYNRNRRAHIRHLGSRVPADSIRDAFEHGLAYHCGIDREFGRWVSRSVDIQTWMFLATGKWRVFHGTSAWLPLLPQSVKGIVTVHDLTFRHVSNANSSYARQRSVARLAQAVRRAEFVIAVSRSTATDLQEYFKLDPKKIHVVYEGVDERQIQWIDPEEKSALRQRWNLPERFLLFVGTLTVIKNVINLIKAFINVNDPDLGLVIVGQPGNQSAEIEAYLRQCPRREKIGFYGYLERGDLEIFYQLATVFMFPSLYEGFGLPVLEAMRRRLPVVTSDNSSLRELFQDSAILVDPRDPADIARGVERILHDESTRAALIEHGETKAREFTWRRTAEQTRELYRSLL